MKSETEFPEHCVTRHTLRVRFFETDLMGIVHHAAYLTFVEAARVEYLRRRGADYTALMRSGHHMPVVEAHLRYHQSSRFDDELVVEARLGLLSRVTVRFDYRVLRATDVVAAGYTLLACVDDSHRPRRIPREIADMLRSAERSDG